MARAQVGGGGPPKRWKGPALAVVLLGAVAAGLGWADKEGHIVWPDLPFSATGSGSSNASVSSANPPRPPTLPADPAPVGSVSNVAAVTTVTVLVRSHELSLFPWPIATTATVTSKQVVIRPELGAVEVVVDLPLRLVLPTQVTPTSRPTTTPPDPVPTPDPAPTPDPDPAIADLLRAKQSLVDILGAWPDCGSVYSRFRRLRYAFEQVFRLEDRVSGLRLSDDLRVLRATQLEKLELLETRAVNPEAYRALEAVARSMAARDPARFSRWSVVADAWNDMEQWGPRRRYALRLSRALRSLYGLPE